MHLQLTHVASGQSTKRYARLVQSYRREDGKPRHRIIGNLGELSDLAVQNIRLALKATRKGKAIVLQDAQTLPPVTLANLAYLDVAVALEMWRSWGLSELLSQLIPEQNVAMRAAEILCALTIQRCVEPASKLQAQSWFPRTALPELLGFAPGHFHNTRIHRVLEKLDAVEQPVQDALVSRYQQRDGAFITLFADVTDAWFEGEGPDLAERGTTKEGIPNRFKVGVLLLCNEHGYPLRWSTLSGRTNDGTALRELVEVIKDKDWAQGPPIVFDRAMGFASAVAELHSSNLRFLTAVPRPETYSYCKTLPEIVLTSITALDHDASNDKPLCDRLVAETCAAASAAGMHRVDDQLYFLDLGICTRRICTTSDVAMPDVDPDTLDGGALCLHQARGYRAALASKTFRTQSEIATHKGITRARMAQVMALLRLDDVLQKEVIAGNYGYISEVTLRDIARLRPKAAQRRALVDHAKHAEPRAKNGGRMRFQRSTTIDTQVRLVLYFNPEMFVNMQMKALRSRFEVEAHARDLNIRLQSKSCKATPQSAHADMRRKLHAMSMVSLYSIHITTSTDGDHNHLAVSLELDEQAWKDRRSTDGFVLLVAHPELPHSAQQLACVYRAKDAVEKDFRTIKTDLKLRPIFHHTNPKVRAHVSLCVLALLLERTLERRLRAAGASTTAPAALQELSSHRLNMHRIKPTEAVACVPNQATDKQRALLASLHLDRLIDPERIAATLRPRPVS